MNFSNYRLNLQYPLKADFTTTWFYSEGEKVATSRNFTERENVLSYLKAKEIPYVSESSLRKEEWKAALRAYSEGEGRLLAQFQEDALKDVGLWGHPRAEKAWEIAWERGHSVGYSGVYEELLDLAHLLLD